MLIPSQARGRACVPAGVRAQYAAPAPLLPSRREYVRCRNVLKNLKAGGIYDPSEEADGPKHQICLNLSCPQYSGGACGGLKGVTQEDAADDLHAITDETDVKPPKQSDSSSDLSDSDFEYLTASVKRRKVCEERGKGERLQLRGGEHVEELLDMVDEQLKKLDERLVRLLAWQRLQQVLCGEQAAGSWRYSGVSSTVRASVERGRLARAGLVRAARPSELLTVADRARIAAQVWGEPPAAPVAGALPPAVVCPPDAVLRATLCPITHTDRNGVGETLGRPVPMRLSSLTIGSDSGCDVRLRHDLCRRVSRRHALIFLDEVSRHFELINYSEFGTSVNGVLYTCDVRDTHVADSSPADLLRNVVRRRMPDVPRINGNLTVPLASEQQCSCAGAGPGPGPGAGAAGAWEGSALVGHGALLQFGCLRYVFSVPDALPDTELDDES